MPLRHHTPLRCCHCSSDLGIMAFVFFGQHGYLGVGVGLVFVVVAVAVEPLRVGSLRMSLLSLLLLVVVVPSLCYLARTLAYAASI